MSVHRPTASWCAAPLSADPSGSVANSDKVLANADTSAAPPPRHPHETGVEFSKTSQSDQRTLLAAPGAPNCDEFLTVFLYRLRSISFISRLMFSHEHALCDVLHFVGCVFALPCVSCYPPYQTVRRLDFQRIQYQAAITSWKHSGAKPLGGQHTLEIVLGQPLRWRTTCGLLVHPWGSQRKFSSAAQPPQPQPCSNRSARLLATDPAMSAYQPPASLRPTACAKPGKPVWVQGPLSPAGSRSRARSVKPPSERSR